MNSTRTFFRNLAIVATAIVTFASILIAGSSGSRSVDAINNLSVLDPTAYGTRPGYIDQATLVVEPHGAYAEQSLYIKYSDHYQYSAGRQLEIVHRFTLPAGATVNDLWLWIGDSVMQAIVLDTWTGRHIYDSIVSKHRDPAFLAKTGEQYELHIYPLTPGAYRKIKMNFIVPIDWDGTTGSVPLPVPFLGANNASVRPLELLFRTHENQWGTPSVVEDTAIHCSPLRDTGGFHYTVMHVPNIDPYNPRTLQFSAAFPSGSFFQSNERSGQPTDFQFGFLPEQTFDLKSETVPGPIVVGLDFSGAVNTPLATMLGNVGSVLHSALRGDDRVHILAAGGGKVARISTGSVDTSAGAIDSVLARFLRSPQGVSIDMRPRPKLLFCDDHASVCWGFQNIDAFASVRREFSLLASANMVTSSDIVAAYDYGHEAVGETSEHLPDLISRIDSLLQNGKRFIGYYDYNRARSGDSLGPHYIPGLTTSRRPDGSVTLYRNVNGNIGRYLPEQIVHYGVDFLSYTPDTSIKVEMADNDGHPVMISKRFNKGLFIISAIWSFKDDDAIKRQISVPLLGLNAVSSGPKLLPALLDTIVALSGQISPGRVFVFSNGDSLSEIASTDTWKAGYMAKYSGTPPIFNTVNLADGSAIMPPYVTYDRTQYYGSGYLLRSLAAATSGSHFESHIWSWPQIVSALKLNANRRITRLNYSANADDGAASIEDVREVNPDPLNPFNARFLIGTGNASTSLTVNLTAWMEGRADSQTVTRRYLLSHDSTKTEKIIPVMLANERVNDIFRRIASTATPDTSDTLEIVRIAMKNRLLCDFTCMLALEPNDTLRFLQNPLDESRFVTGVNDDLFDTEDSIQVGAYPNPFNSTTTISVKLRQQSDLRMEVYNVVGQKMAEFNESAASPGLHTFRWNGENLSGDRAASGVYFVRLGARAVSTGKTDFRVKKVLLVQ